MRVKHGYGAAAVFVFCSVLLLGVLSGCGSTGVTTREGYKLVKDGTLTVGASAEYEPFEYMEDGDYLGFDVDLAHAIADKLGLKVKFENVDFDTITPGVASGVKYDIGIAAITVTPKREKEVDFTDPYYMDDQAIVVIGDNAEISRDNALDVLNGSDVKIAVQSGSTAESFAKENFPKSQLVPFKNATDCFAALQSSQATALVTNRSVAARMISGPFSNERVVKEVSTGEEYSIAVGKNNQKLKEAINRALSELMADGTVDSLMRKYGIQ